MAHEINHQELPPAELDQNAPVPAQADLVCGYPKTGRTWLRFMLASGIAEHYGLGIEVDLTNAYSIVPNSGGEIIPGQPDYSSIEGMPRIEMSHAPYTPDRHDDANIVFLTRDPRDIMVSHWLHNTRQLRQSAQTLTEFVREPRTGIIAFLNHLEGWSPNLGPKQVVTYENMRSDPASALKVITNRFNISLTDAEIANAVESGSMDVMRQKEVDRGIAGHQSLYDRSDPEARRVRRGKVGGYTDYLAPADEAFIGGQIEASSERAKGLIALTGYFTR